MCDKLRSITSICQKCKEMKNNICKDKFVELIEKSIGKPILVDYKNSKNVLKKELEKWRANGD